MALLLDGPYGEEKNPWGLFGRDRSLWDEERNLKAIAQSKKALRAPQGERARAVKGLSWAAQEVRQPRRPSACASRRPICSSRSIAVRNNALIMASALPLGFVVVCGYRFLSCCCHDILTTSSRKEVACSLRVATDEREPRGGAHSEIVWVSCARAERPA